MKSGDQNVSRQTRAATDLMGSAARALKAGRVLSAANAEKLKTALDALLTVLTESGVLAQDDTLEEEHDSKSTAQAGPSSPTPTSETPDTMAIALEVKRNALLARLRQSNAS